MHLKWNTHHSTFTENLSNLRDKQVFTDVTISCGDQFYPAHRLVLSACSSFFARALSVATCRSPVLLLHGIEQSTLEQLLVFMYDGEVTISHSNLPSLLKAARWLGITGLQSPFNRSDLSTIQSSNLQGDSSHILDIWTLFNQLVSSSGDSRTLEQVASTLQQIRATLEQEACGNITNTETNTQPSQIDSEPFPASNSEDELEASVEFKPILIEGDPHNLLGSEEMAGTDNTEGRMSDGITFSNITERFVNSPCPSRQSFESNTFEGWDSESVSYRRKSLEQFVKIQTGVDSEENSQDIVLRYEGSSSEPEKENVDHKLKNATKRFLCCKHCKKTFTVRKDLVEHLKTHEFRDSFCVICEKQFSSTEALDKHLRLRSVYSCSVCRYITHCKQRLTRHHAMHKTKEEMVLLNDEQPAPASQTHTKENNTSAGETLKTDSGSFRCPACDEIFIDYQELKTHSTSGCNRLICKYCNKIFLPSKSRQYNRHLKTHKIKKRFSCPYCPYICDRKRSLTDHISKHTGEYRFSCSLCDYKCTRNVSLKLHMEKKHNDVNCISKSE